MSGHRSPPGEVKALRERTGAGMMDCKAGAAGRPAATVDKAVELLRVKGQAQGGQARRACRVGEVWSRATSTPPRKIGVLVEVDCETDFVARNDDFRGFAREVALHIAAAAPRYVARRTTFPRESGRRSCACTRSRRTLTGPSRSDRRWREGRLRKWLEEVVLLNQAHVNSDKHEGKTIEELRAETAAKTGENVVIRRFARFSVGEE